MPDEKLAEAVEMALTDANPALVATEGSVGSIVVISRDNPEGIPKGTYLCIQSDQEDYVDMLPLDNADFSHILLAAKANHPVRRNCWPEGEFIIRSRRVFLDGCGDACADTNSQDFLRYLADGSRTLYFASSDDLLAEDWNVLHNG